MLSIMAIDVKKYLEMFEKKRTPSHTISLMFDKAIHYDMYSIYIKDENGDNYLFDRYIDGEIKARKWDAENSIFQLDATLSPEQLTPDSFTGIYYYHAHELRFNSLNELSFWRLFRFKRNADKENKRLSREKFLYRQRKQEKIDVMDVLTSAVRIYRDSPNDRPFSELLIMTDVAGKLWIYHDDSSKMTKELRLCLDSLVQNGDLSKTPEGYKPTGKAVNTLSNYNTTEQRYQENIRTQKIMLWATCFAAIGGVGSMIAAFLGLIK